MPGTAGCGGAQVRGGEPFGDVLHTAKLRLRLLHSLVLHLHSGLSQLQGSSQAAAWLLQTRASQAKVRLGLRDRGVDFWSWGLGAWAAWKVCM